MQGTKLVQQPLIITFRVRLQFCLMGAIRIATIWWSGGSVSHSGVDSCAILRRIKSVRGLLLPADCQVLSFLLEPQERTD